MGRYTPGCRWPWWRPARRPAWTRRARRTSATPRALGHLALGGTEGLAHLGGQHPGDVGDLALEQLGRGDGPPAPFLERGRAVGGEGAVGLRQLGLDLLGGLRLEDLLGLTRGGVDSGDGHGPDHAHPGGSRHTGGTPTGHRPRAHPVQVGATAPTRARREGRVGGASPSRCRGARPPGSTAWGACTEPAVGWRDDGGGEENPVRTRRRTHLRPRADGRRDERDFADIATFASRVPDRVLRPILAGTLAVVGGRLAF